MGVFTAGLASSLVRRGHQVTVISQDPAPPGAPYRVAMVPMHGSRLAPLAFPFALRHCDWRGFDVLHAQGDEQWLPRRGRPPLVRTLHGTALAEAWFNGVRGRSAKRLALHTYFYFAECVADLRADAVVAVSEDTRRFYPRVDRVIPNGIDLEAWAPDGSPKSPAPSILFVGEVDSRKRGRLLLDVFLQTVRPAVATAQLWVVSPDRVEGPGVDWKGSVPDRELQSLMRRAWVMCLPSAYEGFGRPYAEALAAGTAVVATPNPGAREVLENGRDGVIASDGALGEALVRVLSSPAEREVLVQRGLERAKAFSWNRVASAYEDVYELAITRFRGSGSQGSGLQNPRTAEPQNPEPRNPGTPEPRNPTRILFLHTTSEIGGSDVSLLRLVERLDRRRFSPVVVLPADGPLVPRLRAAGAEVRVMPSLWKLTSRRGWFFLARFALHFPLAVRQLARFIRRERIAIVHTNTIHNWYGGAAAARVDLPHVWHVREIVWQSAMLRRLELSLVRRWSTRVVVTSDAVAAMFGAAPASSGRPVRIVKVPNGIETDRFTPGNGRRVRDELGIPLDRTLVGIVCRLDAWKGVDVFLEAAAAVARERPAVNFAVIGGPVIGQEAYASSLKDRAEALGLRGRVHFTDWRYQPHDMPDVHRALDVLVLASTEPEPFGLVLIEAMATGKPVIATRQGGPVEIVDDGVTGWLVPPRDASALARAIRVLVDDPASARRMGEAGRQRAVEQYSAEEYVRRIEGVYEEIQNLQFTMQKSRG